MPPDVKKAAFIKHLEGPATRSSLGVGGSVTGDSSERLLPTQHVFKNEAQVISRANTDGDAYGAAATAAKD
jgi:hypothetical protein